MAIVANGLVCMMDYDFDQPPPSLKCVPWDADHITFELIFHPNQSFLDAKPWVGICFAHIISLRYVFLTTALRSIVSSMWVHRDLPSLPAAMAVTSSIDDVSFDGGDCSSPAFRISASI